MAQFRVNRIPIADSGWEDKPHFSSDGKLIFFSSDRDGYRCIWAQAVGSNMHPTGAPFAVYHAHERRRSLRNLATRFEIAGWSRRSRRRPNKHSWSPYPYRAKTDSSGRLRPWDVPYDSDGQDHSRCYL
jgi:hypothetical protein